MSGAPVLEGDALGQGRADLPDSSRSASGDLVGPPDDPYREQVVHPTEAVRTDDLAGVLSEAARGLYEDGRLVPLLHRLMNTSCRLSDSAGSSISIIQPEVGRYTKVAERGTACRLGQSFPLDEGVTGRVMARRGPIVLASYSDVVTGHLPPDSRARDGAVAAIPIWWRGDVIGANVVFAGRARSYTTAEIDELELVTQVVAPGIVTAAGRDLGMSELLRRTDDDRPAPRGLPDPWRATVADVALALGALVSRAAVEGADPAVAQLRVLREQALVRLVVKGEVDATDTWHELVDGLDGTVDAVPIRDADPTDLEVTVDSSVPFTARELQVAELLGQGMSDRSIAEALFISPKTVEKHVGAVLRKSGTTSRTAAVVRALERGWLVGVPLVS